MSEPEVPQKAPYAVDLEPGSYYWCTCGRSSKQPFCDGSHVGTDFSPHMFVVDKAGTQYLCGCKHTKNPPFCDGSHNDL